MATSTEAPPRGPMPVLTRAKRGSKVDPELNPAPSGSTSPRFGKVAGTNVQIGDPEAPSWWQWLDSLIEDEWKRSICYWYRAAPVTDRLAQGKPISLEKWGGKFDQQDVLNRHGSGRYRFDFCYIVPGSQKYVRIAQEFETILDLTKPPRVPLGEWIDNPANKDWEWAKPLLRAEEVEREQQAAEKIAGKPQAPSNPVDQLKETIELAKGMLPADSSQAILLKLLEQSGPANMLTMAKQLAELRQPTGDNNNAMVMLLLDHLLKKENPAPVDPLETTTKLVQGVKGLLDGLGANSAAAAPKLDTGALIVQQTGDILGKAIEQFGPYVPAMIDLVRHVKDRDLQIAQVAAARGMNPTRPWEFQGTAANPPTQAQPAPITAPAPTPAPQNQPMTPQVFFAKHQALLGEVFPILKDKFDNESGYDLADWIIDRKGRDAYNALRKDASVELLMQIAGAVPQLNAIFQPADEARAFFEDFLCDPDNRPEEEPEAQPEGAPVQ